MSSVDLVFDLGRHTAGNPVPLIFGEEGEAAQPQYVLTAAGRLSIGVRGAVRLGALSKVQATGRISVGMRGRVTVGWNVNVSRPTVGHIQTAMEDGQPGRGATAAVWQQAQAVQFAIEQVWQEARAVQSQVLALWQQAERQASAAGDVVQDGQPIRAGVTQAFQQGLTRRSSAGEVFQDGVPIRAAVQQQSQEGVRMRGQARGWFEDGLRVAGELVLRFANGRAVRVDQLGRFEEATKLGPGYWIAPLPPVPEPCYVPGLPAQLLFREAYASHGNLLFTCCKDFETQPPEPGATYVIPVLTVYMQVHTLTAHLLPSLEPVVLNGVTISTDDDSYCWSLSASGPEHLMEQLAPVDGLPPRIQISIDGIQFVFAVISTPRTRAFGQNRVAIQGVSVTAMLADPYMPQQTWLNTAPATAQQLAVQALEYSGVSLDWQIDDWLVPAGGWSHRGTPLQAVMRVAESVGAVVRSHRTSEELIIAPRYPVLPWEWGGATPDVQMPAAVIVTDELRAEPRAEYNAIYVAGGSTGGVLGHVVRSLSARDKLAPQIHDELITHADAARMRGSWALAASGKKLIQSISMPVRTGGTEPGVLQPGQLLEVDDTDGKWRGLVRSVSVTASMPKVRQQVTVERIAA